MGRKKGSKTDKGSRSKLKRPPRPARFSRAWFFDWGRTAVIAIIISIFTRTFLMATFVIDSGSMEETLLVGDYVLVNRMSLGAPIPFTDHHLPGYTQPKHGDIIVFRADHSPGIDIVKRTVGLPGDTLRMDGGILYRNGVAIDEPYVRRNLRNPDSFDRRMLWQTDFLLPESDRDTYQPTRDNWGPITVPEARYFMMGDNRDDSFDSRSWGFVERRKMQGTAAFIYYSYDRDALKPFRALTAMRPGRVGPPPR